MSTQTTGPEPSAFAVMHPDTVTTLLKQETPSDCLALYTWYAHAWALRQNMSFDLACDALKWGRDRGRKVRRVLKDLGLIVDVRVQDRKSGKPLGFRTTIKTRYISQQIKETTAPETFSMDISQPPENQASGGTGFQAVGPKDPPLSLPPAPPLPIIPPEMGIQGETESQPPENQALIPGESPAAGFGLAPGRRETAAERNKQFIPVAEKLAAILHTHKRVRIPRVRLSQWSGDIRRMVEDDGVSVQRIERVLKWYSQHFGETYTPVIESGLALRGKFVRVEMAIKREQTPLTSTRPDDQPPRTADEEQRDFNNPGYRSPFAKPSTQSTNTNDEEGQ